VAVPAVVILRESGETGVAEAVRTDLVLRDWSVTVESFASRVLEARWPAAARPAVLAFVPQQPAQRERGLARLRRITQADPENLPIVVCPADVELPDWVYEHGVRSVVQAGRVSYDRLFEDVFRALVGPLPVWLELRVRPSQMLRPTGVAWWNEDVFVADERYEHVVRLGPADSQVVLPGLFEPHHLHLDRRTLYVANKSANELLVAQLVDDMATEVRSVTDCAGPLRCPHDARCAHFVLAVADTDNHRVLVSRDTNRIEDARWTPVRPERPLRAPCGVHADADAVWVADTFNHRLVAFDHDGRQLGAYDGPAGSAFRYPVAVTGWRDFLFVSDEGSERVVALRRSPTDPAALTVHDFAFAGPWVRQTFGLSVNRENRLAVGDRKQKCVWLVDLEQALAATPPEPASAAG